MKIVSQRALAGALLVAACAVPVEIVEDVQIVSPDGGISSGVGGMGGESGIGGGGTGLVGGSGAGGALGGAPGNGGSGFTQGGTGGVVSMGGSAGMGGSMMAMGGGAGAGMGGAGVEPPLGNCVETGSVGGFVTQVFFMENVQNQAIQITLAIRNEGAAFNMNQLSVRYWFTPGTTQPFTFACYYAQSAANATITDDVNVTFGETPVSAFAEVTIDRTDAMGTGINQIQLDFRAGNVNLVHTDDFSFLDVNGVSTLNPNISAYVDDVQVFGCEPPDP